MRLHLSSPLHQVDEIRTLPAPSRRNLPLVQPLPESIKRIGTKLVTVVREPGTAGEHRFTVDAHIQGKMGVFPIDAPIYEGDVVEYPDSRGGVTEKSVSEVLTHDVGSRSLHHIAVRWGDPTRKPPPVTRLGLDGFHPDVVRSSLSLFMDGHYSQAIFEAFKAVETRVKSQSGIDDSGRSLMTKAFSGDPPPINLAVESGRSGVDEQEGFRFVFMGAMQGIRNPKGHEIVAQGDPQRALEYLALASVLLRRLDDARGN